MREAEFRRSSGEDEVVEIASQLIRIDTSNFGDASGPGERAAAELAAAELACTLLHEAGLEPQLLESSPRRANVVLDVPAATTGARS